MTKQNKKTKPTVRDLDGVFVFKMALYVILGSLWVKISRDGGSFHIPIPVGLIVGMLFTAHEHFKLDRKIEYAVLIVSALFGFVAPYGIFIAL